MLTVVSYHFFALFLNKTCFSPKISELKAHVVKLFHINTYLCTLGHSKVTWVRCFLQKAEP